MQRPIAFITGITGQDGYYLANFLLTNKGYEVHGLVRRTSSSQGSPRLAALRCHPRFHVHYGDLSDGASIVRLLKEIVPSEIYNLAAQSHVGISFDTPEYTTDVNALGVLRILETIRCEPSLKHVKFYQAGTSEMFGDSPAPQTIDTPLRPKSPYAIAKAHAHWMTKMYREAYSLYACNGILFNHESPERDISFVTRKITTGLVRVKLGLQTHVTLGNIHTRRDWGHAKDYVEGIWRVLQQPSPKDYVIATGISKTVQEFVDAVCHELGISITWKGDPCEGYDDQGHRIIQIDPGLYRPSEVFHLEGDAGNTFAELDWHPKHSFEDLVSDMVRADLGREARCACC